MKLKKLWRLLESDWLERIFIKSGSGSTAEGSKTYRKPNFTYFRLFISVLLHSFFSTVRAGNLRHFDNFFHFIYFYIWQQSMCYFDLDFDRIRPNFFMK
jgi:hypothetical protein